jgi:hypothetical protein
MMRLETTASSLFEKSRDSSAARQREATLVSFSQARLLPALIHAGKDASFVSFAESIYEASMALDDAGSVFELAFQTLCRAGDAA